MYFSRLIEPLHMSSVSIVATMERDQVISHIRQVAEKVLPKGSTLYLYGSRARGDFHEDSDWDLLVLLNKEQRDKDDWDNYAWPFTEMGWDINEDISARTFTKNQWYNGPHTMFYYNVEEDKQLPLFYFLNLMPNRRLCFFPFEW